MRCVALVGLFLAAPVMADEVVFCIGGDEARKYGASPDLVPR